MGDGGPRSNTRNTRAAEQELYGLLLATTVASVAVLGTVPAGGAQVIVVNALLGASLVLAFHAAYAARVYLRAAYAVAIFGVIVAVVEAVSGTIGEGGSRLMGGLLVVFGPPAVALGVVRTLRASAAVRVEAVMGVLAFYLLLGLLFAFVIGTIDQIGGGPYFVGGEKATMANCVYFSFTTLTTTGYGDFTARASLGHMLSVFEALIGQIYLVTVVSLIVSNLKRPEARR